MSENNFTEISKQNSLSVLTDECTNIQINKK